jgi:ABC-2 type transport system permease protein
MAVYKRGYQRYRGPLRGYWARLFVLPRFAWERLFQQRLVVILMIVALFWPIGCACYIYLANHLELLQGLGGNATKNFISVNGKFFLVFMNVQSVFCLLLAALAGPGLIAPDLANNALPLYFSRPMTRAEYVGARLLVLAGLLSMVTLIPGLLLLVMQTGMAGLSWLWDNWNLAAGVLGGFVLWIALVSLVALACSAYVKWRIIAGALVLGFFFIAAGLAEITNQILRVDWAGMFNPARAMYTVWCWMLEVDPPRGLGASECAFALVCLAGLLLVILERKLRPVEVIS